MNPIKTTRIITKQECPWLDADLPMGTFVYKFIGATYGCISQDGMAVTLGPDKLPFVEIPRDAIV